MNQNSPTRAQIDPTFPSTKRFRDLNEDWFIRFCAGN